MTAYGAIGRNADQVTPAVTLPVPVVPFVGGLWTPGLVLGGSGGGTVVTIVQGGGISIH